MTARHVDSNPQLAWTAHRFDAAQPWNLRWAGHLYRRAASGASWPELQRALADGPQTAVERLVHPPTDAALAFDREYDRYESIADAAEDGGVLCGWWLRRMAFSPHPLRERMTLFWVDFFAPRVVGAYGPKMMASLVRLLRREALGDFRELLAAAMREAAVVAAASGEESRRPGDGGSLARRLFDRYTLGPGAATAAAVRDASRALAGRNVQDGKYRDAAPDAAAADKAIAAAIARPETARNVVKRLYRALVSETETPAEELIAPLAESFAKDYSISGLVATMLRSQRFFSAAAYRQRIKSPVELAVGLIRAFEQLAPTMPLAFALAGMGQDLVRLPGPSGWEGGLTWIHQAALIQRHNLAWTMLDESGPYGGKLDPEAVARRHRPGEPASRFLLDLLLQGDLDPNLIARFERSDGRPVRQIARAIAALPEYQLA